MEALIEKNYNLKALNTFGIEAFATEYTEIFSEENMQSLIANQVLKNKQLLILGGGSNLLFTKNFDGLIIKNNIKGIEVIGENDDHVFVQAGAGENWHEFVLFCIKNGWNGLENLSLIPGNVGASPMQNIGAYGVEIKDVFYELEAINLHTGEIHYFSNPTCEFGYRESVFKKHLKNQYLITRVTYQLNKKPDFKVEYGAIKAELDVMKVETLSAKAISDAVINIRSSKLPDPKKLGNAGSFFKNPVVDEKLVDEIKLNYPNVVAYPLEDGKVKLAAGWLIEQAGWKGKIVGNCGVHHLQALVLVNHGNATGSELYKLSTKILNSVKEKFNVELEREVNIY